MQKITMQLKLIGSLADSIIDGTESEGCIILLTRGECIATVMVKHRDTSDSQFGESLICASKALAKASEDVISGAIKVDGSVYRGAENKASVRVDDDGNPNPETSGFAFGI